MTGKPENDTLKTMQDINWTKDLSWQRPNGKQVFPLIERPWWVELRLRDGFPEYKRIWEIAERRKNLKEAEEAVAKTQKHQYSTGVDSYIATAVSMAAVSTREALHRAVQELPLIVPSIISDEVYDLKWQSHGEWRSLPYKAGHIQGLRSWKRTLWYHGEKRVLLSSFTDGGSNVEMVALNGHILWQLPNSVVTQHMGYGPTLSEWSKMSVDQIIDMAEKLSKKG